MLKVATCLADEHDLRLVALSALICVLGCFTTTTLMRRADESARAGSRWLLFAAVIFGCSVWSLHFVAMLAFRPAREMSYDVSLTMVSIVVVSLGALAALLGRRALHAQRAGFVLGGTLLGLSVSAMHYLGVAAMRVSGSLVFDETEVVASVIVSVGFSILALGRAGRLETLARRFEVASWLSVAICGLHFTGMAAVAVKPGMAMDAAGEVVLGSTSLAIAVGSVSVVILIASLAATLVEQQMAQRALQELSRMRLMSNLAKEVLFIHRDSVILEVNSAGERLFKAPVAEIVGRSMLSLFTEDSVPALVRRGRCPPLGRSPEETSFQAIDGTRISVELSCHPIDYLGQPATVVVLRDLTDRKRDEARIQHLARHDALTDLPNRHTMLERLALALECSAQAKSPLAVVYLDLDRFKPINDLHGHAAGDALLVQTSQRILAEIQPSDTLARIGGDEFVMILTSDPQPEKVSLLVTRIIETLRRPFQVEGHLVEIGASAGIALYPVDGADADTLIRAADAAMYRVKESGRGALRFYEASMNAQLQARLQLEQELACAQGRGELLLHYQPIVNGNTGDVETFEALIRWQHPHRGMIPPVEFIPLAEEAGLIDQIGRWVIDTACREAATWDQPWRISINVSPKQFHQSDVCEAVRTALRAHPLDPARVVLEVTEGILIDDAPKAVATLNRLREIGVRVALDDFGTGYSSLSYLQLFKFDKFKIDKSFVQKLGQSKDALTITRTIINLGHNLGLQVTAEGVETPDQLEILKALGCDQIQGYLVARPAPMHSMTELDRHRTKSMFVRDHQRVSA